MPDNDSGDGTVFKNVKTGGLPELEELLWEWISIQERSLRRERGDDPLWWCNERPSIGGFAGAIWRLGGFVVEEYKDERRCPPDSSDSPTSRYVRVDMDFDLDSQHYTVEAKQCWPDLGLQSAIDCVKKAMQEAESDFSRLKRAKGYCRLAVVFASPRCKKSENPDEFLPNWIKGFTAFEDWAQAWVFPKMARGLMWSGNDRKYPGAALFIKKI